MSNREEFEKLPEIAMVLEENPDIRFEGDNYIYHGLDEATALATMFIFGAWYAYQEQQKKIDAITKQRDSFIKAHHIAMNDVCEIKAKIEAQENKR